MRHRLLHPLLVFGLALGAASAQASPAPASPPITSQAPHRTTLLSVTAEGESTQIPDVARISAGVSNRAEDARTALAENSVKMNQVIAAIHAAGVTARDVQTRRISIQPRYRHPRDGEPVFTGYQASNSVTVKLRDVERLGDVLDALVANGANEINGPHFEIDAPQAAYDHARLSALDAARQRAQRYADALGMQIVRIVSIDEGGGFRAAALDMVARTASAQAAPPPPPVARGETTLRARLTVVFELGN